MLTALVASSVIAPSLLRVVAASAQVVSDAHAAASDAAAGAVAAGAAPEASAADSAEQDTEAQSSVGLDAPSNEELAEVTVDTVSKADQLRQSAEAVTVVETARAQRESADLGEVLRRTGGIGLQRSGGLGSSTRFSLNGMTDDQVRFFLDGVPLDFSGFSGISVLPVNLVERVELYRGVVPVRFGVDALGGAVNIVTDASFATGASASYQSGSFGTNRLTGQVRHRFGETPFVASASAFYDYADNDYPIEVEVPDALGQLRPARVYRFHDAYQALGASVEVGAIGLPWASRLLLRSYATHSFKEQQHNQVQTLPYGAVESGERALGATLRYAVPLDAVPGLSLEALAAYARRTIAFVDASPWVYDWFGQRISERAERGEIDGAEDTRYVEHRALARLGLAQLIGTNQELRWVSTLNHTSRSGENALYASDLYIDPARAQQGLTTLVSGLEHELDAVSDRLENIAFVKLYQYRVSAEQGEEFGQAPLEQGFVTLESSSLQLGAGNVIRWRLSDQLVAKGAYERAVRLPPAEQVFGDGRLTIANYELEPEVSHNVNLGVSLSDVRLNEHALRGELNGFLRDTDDLIQGLTLGTERVQFHNLWSARTLGIEAAAGWTSPGSWLWLDGNVTWLDSRNTSRQGPFADFEGDRIPNRPWLYANASARLQVAGLNVPNDELTLTWYASYVREFSRSWESAGRADYKIFIDSQLLHSAALTYRVSSERVFSTSVEAQNVTDQRAYDFLGVQKPGRAYYFKVSVEL